MEGTNEKGKNIIVFSSYSYGSWIKLHSFRKNHYMENGFFLAVRDTGPVGRRFFLPSLSLK